MILSSNLLSGGIEDAHLPLFSQESKEILTSFATLMDDQVYIKALSNESQDSDDTLQAIIYKGKNADVDKAIKYLQKMIESSRPRPAYASLGGENGLKLTRSAFAVMIKFSDLLQDFEMLVDTIAMECSPELADKEII